jgi:hypothetical protein
VWVPSGNSKNNNVRGRWTTFRTPRPPPRKNLIMKIASSLRNIILLIIITIIEEIQLMWNVKTKVTPVTIGATGTISKSFRKYLSSVSGKYDIKELQKTAILGTAHTLQKVLMEKHKGV